jgi:hypothetical protein
MAMEIVPTAAVAAINCLPLELTLDILEDLSHTGNSNDIVNALRGCKNWNKLGTHLLWNHAAINNDNILPFVRSLTMAREHIGGFVQNLTILLRPIPSYTRPFSWAFPRLGMITSWKYSARDACSFCRLIFQPLQKLACLHLLRVASRGNVYLAVASVTLATLIKEKLQGLNIISFRYTMWPNDAFSQHAPVHEE